MACFGPRVHCMNLPNVATVVKSLQAGGDPTCVSEHPNQRLVEQHVVKQHGGRAQSRAGPKPRLARHELAGNWA